MEVTDRTQALGVTTSLLATVLLYWCAFVSRQIPVLESEVRTIPPEHGFRDTPQRTHSSQLLLAAATTVQTESSVNLIRAFDLGGSGFKTMRFVYDEASGSMIPRDANVQNLGRCTNNSTATEPTSCAAWLRSQLPSLESELESGYLFGFSLSGLGKLFPDGKWQGRKWGGGKDRSSVRFEAATMAGLFDLPQDRVFSTGDGEAHLLATMNTLKHLKHPIINFALGTGLAIAMSNSQGQILNGSSLLCWAAKGEAVSNRRSVQIVLEVTDDYDGSSSIGPAGRSAAVQALGPHLYRARWERFLSEVMMPLFDDNVDKWPVPGAVVFTGGVVDGLGKKILPKLPNAITEKPRIFAPIDNRHTGSSPNLPAHNLPRYLRALHGDHHNTPQPPSSTQYVAPPLVVQGPRNAGLLGAAWLAARGGGQYEPADSELGKCVVDG